MSFDLDTNKENTLIRKNKKGIINLIKRKISIEKVISVVTFIVLLLAWQTISGLQLYSTVIIPSPIKVVSSFIGILNNGYKGNSLATHLGDSMFRLLTSFFLVIITAIPLGILSGFNSKIRAVIEPLVEFYRPIPPLGYYTLLVLWMGIENSSKIALLYLAGFAPVYIACVSGVKKIKIDYIHAALTLGAGKWQVLLHVILPATLPDIFTGLRTGIGVTYSTLVSAEMVAAVTGIGWMVLDASKFLQSDVIFVGIFIMGFTGIILDRILRFVEDKIVPWEGME